MTLERDEERIFGEANPDAQDSSAKPVARLPLGKNEKREIRLEVVPVVELLNEPAEPTPWLVDGLLPQGGLSILAGKPKAGKSTFARCLALALARGDPIIGRTTHCGPAVYLGHEDKRAEVAEHFRAMGASDEPLLIHTGPAPAHTGTAVEQLRQIIGDNGATIAIIDTLLRFIRVRDVADYAQMTAALDPLLNLSRETDCHVMAVYHAPKADREGLDAILGSVAIGGVCDTGLILKRKSDGQRTLAAIQRYGTDLPETVLALDESSRIVTAGATVTECEQQQLEPAVLQAVAGEPRTEPEIREQIGGDTGKVGRALRDLVTAGRVQRSGEGKRGDPFRYSIHNAANKP